MNTSKQYPKMVMVIRHGEKPGDPDTDKNGGPHLSILGSARAAALPSLFTPDPKAPPSSDLQQLACDLASGVDSYFNGAYGSSQLKAGPSRFPTPDFLFATQHSVSSNRPVETITPLLQALRCFNNPQITINSDFPNDHDGIQELKKQILHNPIYAGKVVLICWHHGKIPELVQALAPSSKLPWSKWPATIFDLILSITWDDGQAKLVIDHQNLLYDLADCDPLFNSGTVTLVLDAPQKPMESTDALPQNFRSVSGCKVTGNLISGSAQYSPGQLQNMISKGHVRTPLTVVDLRQESHGFLRLKKALNGESEVAISWFAERDWINVAKGLPSIQVDETNRLAQAAKSQKLPIYAIDTKTPMEAGICTATAYLVSPKGSYQTEQTLLQALKIDYLRLPTTDRCRPRDSEVDRFITFEMSLEEGSWVHFHCRAGDGRTTTFMAMHDIFHNAPADSLDFILGRQEGLGGIDLRHPSKSEDSFEHPFELERIEFLKNFYNYVCQSKAGGFKLTWSDWVSQNGMHS